MSLLKEKLVGENAVLVYYMMWGILGVGVFAI
jgi:hypothetical protein